jgi:hypothetical protein
MPIAAEVEELNQTQQLRKADGPVAAARVVAIVGTTSMVVARSRGVAVLGGIGG